MRKNNFPFFPFLPTAEPVGPYRCECVEQSSQSVLTIQFPLTSFENIKFKNFLLKLYRNNTPPV